MSLRETPYDASDPGRNTDLGEQIRMLRQEIESRDADIEALRHTAELLYHHLGEMDRRLRSRLRGLQRQVASREVSDVAVRDTAAADRNPVSYHELVRHVQRLAEDALPAGATVAVVSRGDGNLLQMNGRQGWHFPQQDDGTYAGYHPADSASAIAHLEHLRSRGAEFLLIPQTSLWWLDHYADFARHLAENYKAAVRRDAICWIVDLRDVNSAKLARAAASKPQPGGYGTFRIQVSEIVSLLLPANAAVLVVGKGDDELLRMCGAKAQHFPQDASGKYAGYHPANSAEAIAHLEMLRSRGAEYLLIPQTSFWWLKHYAAFKEHLVNHYALACRQEHLCLIFDLQKKCDGDALRPLDLK